MLGGSPYLFSSPPNSPLGKRSSTSRATAPGSPRSGPAVTGPKVPTQPPSASSPRPNEPDSVNAQLQGFAFPVSASSSSREGSLTPSTAGRVMEDPVRKIFTVPPPLVVCLVQHLDRELQPVATPTCVEKCVQELQDYFNPSIAAEQVCGASTSPSASAVRRGETSAALPAPQGASRVGQGCFPGSRLQLQFGKALNIYANAGAAVLNILIYAVDEPYSRPRVLAHIAKAWRDELAKTGGESSCIVFLHHKEMVAAANATQQLSRESVKLDPQRAKQNARKLYAAQLNAATSTLEDYYKELTQLKFSAHQMCAYTPNEAPMRVLERLHVACEEKCQRLRSAYEQYLVKKRIMARRSSLSATPTTTATRTNLSASSSAPQSQQQQQQQQAATTTAAWSVQRLWQFAQDFAQHCLQFGLVKDARTMYERAFLVYYNNSDDFALVDKLSTLEALGKTPDLFSVRHRAGAQLTRTGYPQALTTPSEPLEGLLYIAGCAMQCCLLDKNVEAAQRHFDMLMQIMTEKFSEAPADGQPVSNKGAAVNRTVWIVHQQFFSLQCYLSATRTLWSSYGFSTETSEWTPVALEQFSFASFASKGLPPQAHPPAITREGSAQGLGGGTPSAVTDRSARARAGYSPDEGAEEEEEEDAAIHMRVSAATPPPAALTEVGQDAAEAAAAVGVATSRAAFRSPNTRGQTAEDGADDNAFVFPMNVDLRCSIIAPPAGYVPPPPTSPASSPIATAPPAPQAPTTEAERLSQFVEAVAAREDVDRVLTLAPAHLRGGLRRLQHQYAHYQQSEDRTHEQQSSEAQGGLRRGEYGEHDTLQHQRAMGLLTHSHPHRSRGVAPIEDSLFLAVTYLVALGQELGLVPMTLIPALPGFFDNNNTSADRPATQSFPRALKTLQQNCQHLSRLTLGARACVAYLTHALGYEAESPVFAEAGFVARQWGALWGNPSAEQVAGIRQAEEMQDGTSMRVLWQRLTLLSAAGLSLAGARRREFYLYTQLTLSCFQDDPKRAATFTMRRLLPCVRDVGWDVLEFAVRRLYVECLAQLQHDAAGTPAKVSAAVSSVVASAAAATDAPVEMLVYLYTTDAAYALYKECVLYLVRTSNTMATTAITRTDETLPPVGDALRAQPTHNAPLSTLDAEAIVAVALKLPVLTREAWWSQLRRVDDWMNTLFLKRSGPLRYPMNTLLRSPRITASAGAVVEDTQHARTRHESSEGIVVSLGSTIRVMVEGFCPVDPLALTSTTTATASRSPRGIFLLTLESRKEWQDAAEPTHVVQLEAGQTSVETSSAAPQLAPDYTYNPSTGLLTVVFSFCACHAGAYRVRCFELRVGGSWFALYPRQRMAVGNGGEEDGRAAAAGSRSVDRADRFGCFRSDISERAHPDAFRGVDAAEDDEDDAADARRGQRLEEQFAACVAMSTMDSVEMLMCVAVLFRVKEPESRLRLRVVVPPVVAKEYHLFADSTEYMTVCVESDEPLMPLTATTAPVADRRESSSDVVHVASKIAMPTQSLPPNSAGPLTPAQRLLRQKQQQRGSGAVGASAASRKACVFEAPLAMFAVTNTPAALGTSGGSLARGMSVSPASAALEASFLSHTGNNFSFANLPWPSSSSSVAAALAQSPQAHAQIARPQPQSAAPTSMEASTTVPAVLPSDQQEDSDDAAAAVLGVLTVHAGGSGSGGAAGSALAKRGVTARSVVLRSASANLRGATRVSNSAAALHIPLHHASTSPAPVYDHAAASLPSMSVVSMSDGVSVKYATPAAPATAAASPASISLPPASAVSAERHVTATPTLNSPEDGLDTLDASHASSNRIQYHHVAPVAALAPDDSSKTHPSFVGNNAAARAYTQPHRKEELSAKRLASVSATAPPPCALQEQMRVTVADEVASGDAVGDATQLSGSASTIIPIDEHRLLGALPRPVVTRVCSSALGSTTEASSAVTIAPDGTATMQVVGANAETEDSEAPAFTLQSLALLPAQRQWFVQLSTNSSIVAPAADATTDVRAQRTSTLYEMKIPVLPIFVSRHARTATASTTSLTEAEQQQQQPRKATLAFTCWRGGESTSSRLALALPFRSAIETTYHVKQFQGHVYCLVTMRNVLQETSLWLRGAQLHVLDTSPTYEVVRVSSVYERLLETEWKAGECFQLLFELALCSTYQGTEAVRHHRVQLSAFYSDWSKTFLETPEDEKVTLRLMGTVATEEGAESVCVEGDGSSLLHQSTSNSARRSTSVCSPLHQEAMDSAHSYNADWSEPRAVGTPESSNKEARHNNNNNNTRSLHPCSSSSREESASSSQLSANMRDGAARVRSSALRYNTLAASVLSSRCNHYYAPTTSFESKHMCLFSAVMYAESPWTQRFGATMNYTHRRVGVDNSSFRSTHMDSLLSRAMTDGSGAGGTEGDGAGDVELLADVMVDAPADFAFVAGEPVRFCVRLEPHAQNWPEDAGLEEDFIVELRFDPHEWMVIGKKRERRTLSLMQEATVTFTAVPLLPPSSSAAAHALACMSGAATASLSSPSPSPVAALAKPVGAMSGARDDTRTSPSPALATAAEHPAGPSLRPAGGAVVDEGVIKTPIVELYWADRVVPYYPDTAPHAPSPSPAALSASQWATLMGRTSPAAADAERDRSQPQTQQAVRNAPVLFDLVQFRTSVRVCKKSATIRRGGGGGAEDHPSPLVKGRGQQ